VWAVVNKLLFKRGDVAVVIIVSFFVFVWMQRVTVAIVVHVVMLQTACSVASGAGLSVIGQRAVTTTQRTLR
jgi:hypothetical protein